MKAFKIPKLASLDVLDLSSVSHILETKAHREYIDVVNWSDYPYKPIVAVNIARSNENLYLGYFVRENSPKAIYSKDGSPVHKDSCVEFFMKRCESPVYINFEFNCIGTCDASYRESREKKTPLTQDAYAAIRRYSSLPPQTFEEKTGIYSWELLVSIPLTLMGLNPKRLPEKILANFYKCADETSSPHFLSWNPIDLPRPDFHCPQFFGELYF